MKDIYKLHKLGRTNGGSLISVDKSLFDKQNGTNIWILGAKNNKTLNIRLGLFKSRNEEDCKKLITNYNKPHNRIITDEWRSYNFLDNTNSEYEHKVHIHGPMGNFGLGLHSTSFIEGVWGIVKNNIKKIYNSIPDDNLILFLREGEFR